MISKPSRTIAEQERLGKKWGAAHGYRGNSGGWIYPVAGGAVVCQGWAAFYRRHWFDIEFPKENARCS